MITVGNIKQGAKGIYIGRAGYGRSGSPLGNPFPLRNEADRAKVIASYETWLNERIREGDPAVLGELARIKEASREGDVTLLCWCSPRGCHGDVIKKVIEGMP